MKLRNLPLMTYGGLPNWPPVWVETGGQSQRSFRAEMGTLKEVRMTDSLSDKFFLVIEHEGATYIGCLAFTSRAFCWLMHKLLQSYIDYPIESIGNLDLDIGGTSKDSVVPFLSGQQIKSASSRKR